MPTERFVRQSPDPIPLDALRPPEFDVREYRTDEDIENTATTLEKEGQVLPILVGAKQDGQYPILDGNHRYLAAKRWGWPNIDAIKTKAGVDEDEVQIVANISRLELSPSERLAVFEYMLGAMGMTVTDAADRVGIDRSQAHRYKKILRGYGEIKQYYMEGEIGVHAAYELNQVEDRDRAVDIAETAVREGYVDKDVVKQAKFARGDEEAEDEMRGAGTERNVTNMQQVKRNAEALQELDPIDQGAVQDAQVADSAAGQPAEGQDPSPDQQEPSGPPCAGCGRLTDGAVLSQVRFHPKMAEQLGLKEIKLCPDCTGGIINWWQQRQAETDVDGEPLEAE